jgi:transglutaminase-like putative cysteine protease
LVEYDWKIDNLRKAQNPEKLVILLLLFFLLSFAAASVSSLLSGPSWSSIWQGLIFGLLIGWMLAIFKQSFLKSFLFIIILGLTYAIFYVGSLWVRIGPLLVETFHLVSQFVSSPRIAELELGSLIKILVDQLKTSGVVLERVRTWIIALVGGQPSFDPVATTFMWIVLLWIVAAWAGWVVIAKRNALLAILPILILSLGTLSSGQKVPFSIYILFGLSLLALAAVQHYQREEDWEGRKIAYPPRLGRHIGVIAVLLSIGLVFSTAVISSFEMPRFLEWVSGYREVERQVEGNLANSLGIVSEETSLPDAFEDFRKPGLPRNHLIGSSPELSRHLVMTVAVSNMNELFQEGRWLPLYWRSLTYDIYTGHGWQSTQTYEVHHQPNQPLQLEQVSQSLPIEQKVRSVDTNNTILYAAGEPFTINQNVNVAWRDPGDLFGILMEGTGSYSAKSYVSFPDEQVLRGEGQNYPQWVQQHFLDLPSGVPDRVKDLARELTAGEPTPYDRVKAIEQYLRSIPYTLEVPYPPHDRDLVDFFLFDLRKGYCDYYASAMVVLARAAGVPARFVMGYANGTYDLNAKVYRVTEADAHSWVEIYFSNYGWVPFEPTASRPQFDRTTPSVSEFKPNLAITEPRASTERDDLLIPGWYFPIGIIFFLGLFGIIWAVVDMIMLSRLSEPAAAIVIYQRLRRYGEFLAVTSDPGETPYEFAASFQLRLRQLSQLGYKLAISPRLYDEVASIIDRIVKICYRPTRSQYEYDSQIYQQWKELRWYLRLMRIVQYYQSMRMFLMGLISVTNHINRSGEN